jgi:two-component system, LytTR family, response regulator
MRINAVIVDDDQDSRLITGTFVRKYFPDVHIAGEGASVQEGLNLLQQLKPDLLLLDIEMPDGTGFDLLRNTEDKNFEVIFITAFDAYAIDAFKFSAIDYLLKPLSLTDLKDSMLKVKERIQSKLFERHWINLSYNLDHKNNYDRKLAIATISGFVFVDVKDIVRCESQSNYTQFHFENGKKMTSSRNLGYYEEILPVEKFCRIHHSHLINIDFLNQYIKGGSGGTVIMKDGAELDVSQRKKEDFLQKVISGR